LNRAFSSISLWQKLKFGFSILTNKETVTPEEVERCKQKDLLKAMLEEVSGRIINLSISSYQNNLFILILGEFPELSRVIVKERDVYLANVLRMGVDSPIPRKPE